MATTVIRAHRGSPRDYVKSTSLLPSAPRFGHPDKLAGTPASSHLASSRLGQQAPPPKLHHLLISRRGPEPVEECLQAGGRRWASPSPTGSLGWSAVRPCVTLPGFESAPAQQQAELPMIQGGGDGSAGPQMGCGRRLPGHTPLPYTLGGGVEWERREGDSPRQPARSFPRFKVAATEPATHPGIDRRAQNRSSAPSRQPVRIGRLPPLRKGAVADEAGHAGQGGP
eukprot:scaffold21017_cov104-Isochrysis_galbana.AAC.3